MDLPKNTAVVDYRIHRRLGYWNGEGLSDSPVFEAERPSGESLEGPRGGGRRWIAVVSGIMLLVVVLWFMLFRSRVAKKPGRDSAEQGKDA
jgi:hypothetical protein